MHCKNLAFSRENYYLYCTLLFGGYIVLENWRAALPMGIPERNATPRRVRKVKKRFPAADLSREPILLLSGIVIAPNLLVSTLTKAK